MHGLHLESSKVLLPFVARCRAPGYVCSLHCHTPDWTFTEAGAIEKTVHSPLVPHVHV